MKRPTTLKSPAIGFFAIAVCVTLSVLVVKQLWAVSYPPSPGFEKFSLQDTSKFHLTNSFSVFDKDKGYVRNISLRYVYKDGRYARMHSYDTDIVVEIGEFATAEQAQAYLKKRMGKTIPEEKASTVKLPPCKGKKSDKDEFLGPEKLQKKLHHPSGSEIFVTHSGDFNMYDCTRGSNKTEDVRWTDGAFCFEVSTDPVGKGGPDTGYGRAEEFALDYLTALGQPATP